MEGTKYTKDGIARLQSIIRSLKKVLANGKIDLTDWASLAPILADLKALYEISDEIAKELRDLTFEEVLDIMSALMAAVIDALPKP